MKYGARTLTGLCECQTALPQTYDKWVNGQCSARRQATSGYVARAGDRSGCMRTGRMQLARWLALLAMFDGNVRRAGVNVRRCMRDVDGRDWGVADQQEWSNAASAGGPCLCRLVANTSTNQARRPSVVSSSAFRHTTVPIAAALRTCTSHMGCRWRSPAVPLIVR